MGYRSIRSASRLALVFALSAVMAAQSSAPRSNNGSPDPEKGFLSRVEFGGSANSLADVFTVDGSAGYQFNKHFALDFGVPVYMTHASGSSGLTSGNGIGDPYMQMLLKAPNPTVNYTGLVTTSVPLGDTKKGLSTGRVGIDFSNRFDHSFSRITPFGVVGIGNTIRDTRFFRRPFTSLGFNAHFEGGADVDISKYFSVGASAYDIAPSGTQKVYSKIVAQGGTGSAGAHGRSFGASHTTVGDSSLTADYGFSTWLDANPNKVVDLELAFSRSMSYDLNTVSFTVGVNIAQVMREGSRH